MAIAIDIKGPSSDRWATVDHNNIIMGFSINEGYTPTED